MRHFGCRTSQPLHFSVCGQLISPDGFLHHRRSFDFHVLILVTEGKLHITSNGIPRTVTEGQYLFLKAGEEHMGHMASDGRLSYLWVHFQADKEFEAISEHTTAENLLPTAGSGQPLYSYLFPEYGSILRPERISLLFHQLMDISFEEHTVFGNMPDYALSLLLMELSQEYDQARHSEAETRFNPVILSAAEWIKRHCLQPFTVSELANELGYNADYLSSLFRRSMGISIIGYTNQLRIRTAKKLFSNYNPTVKEAAYSCGFSDEKYFMKVFKRIEGITPTEYKTAFCKKRTN